MRIILLGAPGVGKGTQGKLVAQAFGIPAIATGDILRGAVEAGSELGRKAHSFMERGDLVPDDIIIGVVEERLAQSDATNGFLLDGFPRTVAQAEALDAMLLKNGWPVDAIIAIDVDEEALVSRLSGRSTCPNCGAIYHSETAPPKVAGTCDNCGSDLVIREDDRPEAVRRRLGVYREKTAPVMDFYSANGRLKIVNGAQAREDVTQDLMAVLG